MAAGTRRIARSPSLNRGGACGRCLCAALWPCSPCYGVPEAVLRLATACGAGQTPSTGLTWPMPLASAPGGREEDVSKIPLRSYPLDEVLRAIPAGVTYGKVHSVPRFCGGEIRGQIRDEDED